jgi:hypothetical protein
MAVDREAGAASIHLGSSGAPTVFPLVARTETAGPDVHLDFDADDRLVGIDILALFRIRPELLAEAEQETDAP